MVIYTCKQETHTKERNLKMKSFVDVFAVILASILMLFGAFIVFVVLSNVFMFGVSINAPALFVGMAIFAFGAYMF